jgi:pimeloyl-ACP methyl ester carboxylesterase
VSSSRVACARGRGRATGPSVGQVAGYRLPHAVHHQVASFPEDRDELLGRQQGDALAAAVRGSRLVGYEETGHLVLREWPDRVAADIREFARTLGA